MLKVLVTLISFLASCFVLMAQSVRIEDVSMREVYVEGFSVSRDSKATISGHFSLLSQDVDDSYFGSAWIYNVETNEVLWELQNSQSAKQNSGNIDVNESISIPKGNYELYFSTYPNIFRYNNPTKNKGKWDKLLKIPGAIVWGIDGFEEFRKESREWFVQVKSADIQKTEGNPERNFKNEFISFKKAKNDQSYRKTFEISKTVKLRIISQGEGVNNNMVDYGLIRNVDTREIVWQMDYENTMFAGGAEKNRRIDEAIELKPGRYEVVYKTDDSHSFDNWNDSPPYDSQFWGIALLAIDQNSLSSMKTTDVEKTLPSFIDINRVGDSKVIKKYFKILKTCKVNVYAVGEGSYKQMSDYGWIENVDNNERVWQMEFDETEHAGGAEKNRLVDAVLKLEPGVYAAYYVTDDSHSYEDWNSAEPLNPEDWGMKIRLLEKGSVSDYVEMVTKYSSPNMLVNLTPIGDDANETTEFVLTKPTKLKIVAIGEGDDGEMYDYGWIEDENTGDIVWEMTYRKTKHAGGAEKNRKIDQTVLLEKGNYKVFFQTDGSHAFGDWNSTPPDDQSGWGIKIYKNE